MLGQVGGVDIGGQSWGARQQRHAVARQEITCRIKDDVVEPCENGVRIPRLRTWPSRWALQQLMESKAAVFNF